MTVSRLKDFYDKGIYTPGAENGSGEESINLNQTERWLINLLANGKSTSELATEMDVSEYTILVYYDVITKKMRVNDITQALIKAIRQGVIET
ncbi:MAG: LuxR C-terminal-related transcriptional regulator [Pseudomonadota bacterium]